MGKMRYIDSYLTCLQKCKAINLFVYYLPPWLWVSNPSQFWYVFKGNTAIWLIIFTEIIFLILLQRMLEFLYCVWWDVANTFLWASPQKLNPEKLFWKILPVFISYDWISFKRYHYLYIRKDWMNICFFF